MKLCNWMVYLFLLPCVGYGHSYEYEGICGFKESFHETVACLEQELKAYDEILNKLYKQYNTNNSSNKLKKAERLWIKYVEADCEHMGIEVNEGKQFDLIYDICLLNKTKDRIKDLRRSSMLQEWFLLGNHRT